MVSQTISPTVRPWIQIGRGPSTFLAKSMEASRFACPVFLEHQYQSCVIQPLALCFNLFHQDRSISRL
jgi:hypothetical protein